MEKKPCVIAIAGANASGKSELGIRIAREFGGEIISVDSRQVYRKMDLGTGKVEGSPVKSLGRVMTACEQEYLVEPRESEGILHWLIDIVEPAESFTVAAFQKLAWECVREIMQRKRLPVLAGGTGLYLRAVVEGLNFPRAQNSENLRAELEQKTPDELREMLLAHDKEAAQIIDLQNPRRMIRALEIALTTGEPLSIMRKKTPVFFRTLTLGISITREELKERIKKRLDMRLKKGMVEEVEMLLREGVTGDRLEALGLEYRYIYRFISRQLGYEEMKEDLYRAICRFAKRQYTWFKKYGEVTWISGWEEARALVEDFLHEE